MKHDAKALKPVILAARLGGATLAASAARAGVHVATVCRWQARDAAFAAALRRAEWAATAARYASRPDRRRPSVPWRDDCPECGSLAVVRATEWGLVFWGCGRWPRCWWASWRPRYGADCPRCGAARYWSHSRRSVGCGKCGL